MTPPLVLLLALLAWGIIVGLDLVTFPQAMVSRPIVAGTVTGLLIGALHPDLPVVAVLPGALLIGAVLELFALDVLPVGAARYPDYGPATVAAVYAGLEWRPEVALGVSIGIGLMVAVIGGWAMQWMRRANAAAIQRRVAELAAGDRRAIRALHLGGIRRDMARSAAVTLLGLVLASVIWPLLPPGSENYAWLSAVAVGAGMAAALGGAIRSAGRTIRLAWVLAGLACGGLLTVLR